ncbi:MAG: hypothetical protein Q7S18_00555 [bacterium]|nr:hypothetical protein [bacterium]
MFLKNRYERILTIKPSKNAKNEYSSTFLTNGNLRKFLIFLYKKKKAIATPSKLKIPSKDKELSIFDKCIEKRALTNFSENGCCAV